MSKHAVIWIDHKEARVFDVHPDTFDGSAVQSPTHHVHRHPKGGEGGKEHPDDAKHFFHEVARALEAAEEVLIVGPSTAKLELIRYAHEHERALERKIVGVETVDHPSDGQLVAYARKYFRASDRMR